MPKLPEFDRYMNWLCETLGHRDRHRGVADYSRGLMLPIEWVSPRLQLDEGCYWIVDDTGLPKKGEHSVGVARQYCGELGKNENCQVAVSLSLASHRGSIPISWQLYLPKEWTDDKARCAKVGVPKSVYPSRCASPPSMTSRSNSYVRRRRRG
jgi:SRSO17 transposase